MVFIKKQTKKIVALLLIAVMLFSITACTQANAIALEIDGVEIGSGLYLHYVFNARQEWQTKIREESPEIKEDDIFKAELDGKKFDDWTTDRAVEMSVRYAAIEIEFDRLELELTEEALANIKSNVSYSWGENQRLFVHNGVREPSLELFYANYEKHNILFEKYFGKDGIEEVKDKELRKYFNENFVDIDFIMFSATEYDQEGNPITLEEEEQEKKLKDFNKKADKYVKRINTTKDTFTKVNDEYNAELKAEEEAAKKAAEEAAKAAEEESGIPAMDGEIDPETGEPIIEPTDPADPAEEEAEQEPPSNRMVIFTGDVEEDGEEEEEETGDAELMKAIADDKNLGKAFKVDLGTEIYVFYKYDVTKKKSNFTDKREEALLKYKTEDFSDKIKSWQEKQDVKRNDFEIGRLKASKLEDSVQALIAKES